MPQQHPFMTFGGKIKGDSQRKDALLFRTFGGFRSVGIGGSHHFGLGEESSVNFKNRFSLINYCFKRVFDVRNRSLLRHRTGRLFFRHCCLNVRRCHTVINISLNYVILCIYFIFIIV